MAIFDANRGALSTKSLAIPKVGPMSSIEGIDKEWTGDCERSIGQRYTVHSETTGMHAAGGVISCTLEEGG
jgi:hypothetical protein